MWWMTFVVPLPSFSSVCGWFSLSLLCLSSIAFHDFLESLIELGNLELLLLQVFFLGLLSLFLLHVLICFVVSHILSPVLLSPFLFQTQWSWIFLRVCWFFHLPKCTFELLWYFLFQSFHFSMPEFFSDSFKRCLFLIVSFCFASYLPHSVLNQDNKQLLGLCSKTIVQASKSKASYLLQWIILFFLVCPLWFFKNLIIW